MEHPPELKEIEELYQLICKFWFGYPHVFFRVSFICFDHSSRPVIYGYDCRDEDDVIHTISYNEEDQKWKIVDENDNVEAWSTEEPNHPHLPPTRWHFLDQDKYDYIDGWENDVNMMNGKINSNEYTTTYAVKTIHIINKLKNKYPILREN